MEKFRAAGFTLNVPQTNLETDLVELGVWSDLPDETEPRVIIRMSRSQLRHLLVLLSVGNLLAMGNRKMR